MTLTTYLTKHLLLLLLLLLCRYLLINLPGWVESEDTEYIGRVPFDTNTAISCDIFLSLSLNSFVLSVACIVVVRQL